MKKLIFPIAAFAMAAFVACGDDSSSDPASAAPATKTDVVPASVEKFYDTDNITCSETVNKCKTVVVVGYTEVAQCNGVRWDMQTLQEPVAGCENAVAPADNSAPVTNCPSGNMVSCDIPGVLGECMEFEAGSPEAIALESQCVSNLMGVLGKGCAK